MEIQDLENLAMSQKGVTKAYAIQAGREFGIMVECDQVTECDSARFPFGIWQTIQKEMTYPGQVKITVTRETRAVNVAR